MQMSFTIKLKDHEETTCIAEFQDLVAFEREFSKSIARFQDDLFLTDFAWLAWHAQERRNETTLTFDDWVALVEKIEGREDEIVPLEETTPLTGSLPVSA